MLTPTMCHTVACVAASTIRTGTATSTNSKPMPCVNALASSSIRTSVVHAGGGECISYVIVKGGMVGVPGGIRTRVTAVKGRCPRPG